MNLPFLWTGGDGEFFIPRGTPLVQVIPIRREAVALALGVIDWGAQEKTAACLGTRMRHGYRDLYWHKGRAAREAGRDDSAVAAEDGGRPRAVTAEEGEVVELASDTP